MLRKSFLDLLRIGFGDRPLQWAASLLIGLGMVLVLASKIWPVWALLLGYGCLLAGIPLALWADPDHSHLGPISLIALLFVLANLALLLALAFGDDLGRRLVGCLTGGRGTANGGGAEPGG